jgi:uncharacterized protein YndB with AHSA1/START domain
VNDLIAELERVRRTVRADTADTDTGAGHVVELRRTYDALLPDVWDACTSPDRIRRWFLPVSGDLRPGGSYQLEGNAGGDITACEPPRRMALTWVFGGDASIVSLDLNPLGEGSTELLLRHAVGDNDHWTTYGPGAVGVGWDLALLGLARYLDSGESAPDPAAFAADPKAVAFIRRSAQGWGDAHAASGVPPATAAEAADRTSAAYAPDPAPAPNA